MKPIIIVVILVILGGAGWYFISPLFINDEVNEELGFAFDTNQITEGDFADMSVEERREAEAKMLEESADMPDVVMDEDDPTVDAEGESEASLVAHGTFSGTDALHQGSGQALVIQNGDETIIRFENFDVTNGPDLHVVLSKETNLETFTDLGDHINLGELKGNVGNQNYVLPAGVDISDYSSIVIYCQPFHVNFAVAEL